VQRRLEQIVILISDAGSLGLKLNFMPDLTRCKRSSVINSDCSPRITSTNALSLLQDYQAIQILEILIALAGFGLGIGEFVDLATLPSERY